MLARNASVLVMTLLAGGCSWFPSLSGSSSLGGRIATDAKFADKFLDKQETQTDRTVELLRHMNDPDFSSTSVLLSGAAIGLGMFEDTNTAGSFPILSRLPIQHDPVNQDSKVVFQSAVLAATIAPTSWFGAHVQGEYSGVAYPGTDDVEITEAYVVMRDPQGGPLYAAIGRQTVDFGQNTSLTPFTHSHNAHYFLPKTKDVAASVGLAGRNWNASATAIQGGRGRRVLDTADESGVRNFAVNLRRRFDMGEDKSITVGAGYLHDTIYNAAIAHHPPGNGATDDIQNGAWTVFSSADVGPVDLAAEFTQTTKDWPAGDAPVSAWTVQGRYNIKVGDRPAALSAMFSRGKQGEDGTEWEKMDQAILGAEVSLTDNLQVGAELVHNTGFVPLIDLQTSADASVKSNSVVVGGRLVF